MVRPIHHPVPVQNKAGLTVFFIHSKLFKGFASMMLVLLSACEHTTEKPVSSVEARATTVKSIVVNATAQKLQATKPLAVQKREQKPVIEQDLWHHITNQTVLSAPHSKYLFWHIDWFKKHPNYLTRVTKRAKPYLHWVTQAVEAAGLPMEIALLPIVESAYYPFSFSHGTASGLWQFIPSTGRLYGLKQNYWTDERRSVVLSTRAAIAYLKNLHTLFKGDWLLAIAAYNSGPGRVQKAIEKNRIAGKKTDFWHIDLPAETKGYVPRLLAVTELIKHPQRYNQTITPVANQAQLALIYVYSQLDLALVSEFTGLSLDEIYNLNPDINRWATPDSPRYEMLLPIDKVAPFKQALSQYPRQKRLNYKRYKIQSGDSLIKLAKRFNTSVDHIKGMNHLTSNKITAGKTMIIPVPQQPQDYYSLSADQRAAQRLGSKKNGVKVVHTVQAGDSLWLIAKKYNQPIDNIVKWNHLSNATKALQIGQKLVLWQVPGTTAASLKGLKKIGVTVNRKLTYRVKQGDSLSTIAHKFGVDVDAIVAINQLDKYKALKIGKKLKIIKPIVRQ